MKILSNQAPSLAVGVIMTSFFVGTCWCMYVHDSFMPTKLGTHVHPRVDTVQEYLLARVIFDEFVCKKRLADFILAEFLQF